MPENERKIKIKQPPKGKEVTFMPTCGECKLLVPNPKGEGYKCLGRRCGATKVTPDKDASRCTKFDKK